MPTAPAERIEVATRDWSHCNMWWKTASAFPVQSVVKVNSIQILILHLSQKANEVSSSHFEYNDHILGLVAISSMWLPSHSFAATPVPLIYT